MYDDVEQALRTAYRIEGNEIYKGPSFFNDLTGSTVRSRGDGPWDRLADAVNLISITRKYLNLRQNMTIRAYYTLPTPIVVQRKKHLVSALGSYLWKQRDNKGNRHLITDFVREWSGLKRHHNDTWWAKHMECQPSTIHYLRKGRPDRNQRGIIQILDDWLEEGHRVCEIALSEHGIIP